MKITTRVAGGTLIALVLALSGCATSSPAHHRYVMQGQVLSVAGNRVDVCVGERDGAVVGQVIEVIRHVPRTASPKASGPSFRREDVGAVRVVEVFDEHYATAEIVSGRPQVNDSVELHRP
jgi:hypothetical protein